MEEPSGGAPCRYNEWLFGEKIEADVHDHGDEVAFGSDDAP